MHRTVSPTRIICAIPRASLRSVLLICASCTAYGLTAPSSGGPEPHFIGELLPIAPLRFSLQLQLRPESGHESASPNSAHIGIVLNHRLDQEGSRKHQDIEL